MCKYKGQIFLLCLFLTGLLTVFPYGAHLDQKPEQEILYSNIKMYLGYFGEEEGGFYQKLDAAGIIDIADSIEKDHGMAVYYPVFWIFHVDQVSTFYGNIVWHVYIYFLVFCGVAALFLLLKEMFGSFKIAAPSTAMFFFTPRIFGESHYNNKDMVLLSLVLCVFYFGWKLLKERSWKYVVAFSLAGSLAANMKVIGIFIWGLVGLYALSVIFYERRFDRKMFGKMITCIFLTGAFFAALTPACWDGLREFLVYLLESAKNFRWNDYIFFEGTMYNKSITGIPRKYLPVIILLTVPVGILLLALIGMFIVVFRLCKKPAEFFGNAGYSFIMILAGAVPLAYAVLSGTPVYNGWRHFYFCYASAIIAVSWGVSLLLRVAQKYQKRLWADVVLAVYIGILAVGIAVNYPQEYAYYNFLAGEDIESKYELDYWDMSFKQAYGMILKHAAEEDVKMKIGTISNPAFWGLEAQLEAMPEERRMRVGLCDEWQDAEYLIINPTYAHMYGSGEYEWIKQNYRLVDVISSYGNAICEIYQK